MTDTLAAIDREVQGCSKCAAIKNVRVLPRSGFPEGRYEIMIIGAEPGRRAKRRLTPEEYKAKFVGKSRGSNKAALIITDLEGISSDRIFFTNSTKCPAFTAAASRSCFENCKSYLSRQIAVIQPKLIVTIGRASSHLGLRRPGRANWFDDLYRGIRTISVRHPQGATLVYRQEVAAHIRQVYEASTPPNHTLHPTRGSIALRDASVARAGERGR